MSRGRSDSAGWRPSRMASTMSGASSVSCGTSRRMAVHAGRSRDGEVTGEEGLQGAAGRGGGRGRDRARRTGPVPAWARRRGVRRPARPARDPARGPDTRVLPLPPGHARVLGRSGEPPMRSRSSPSRSASSSTAPAAGARHSPRRRCGTRAFRTWRMSAEATRHGRRPTGPWRCCRPADPSRCTARTRMAADQASASHHPACPSARPPR